MRSGDVIWSFGQFLEALQRNFENPDVEDLPAEVVTMLCAFQAMSHESRKTFLLHVADCYCIECGEANPPIDDPDGGKCRCFGP